MYTDEPGSVKQRLLEAAVACLQERGYAKTTARDVAGRAEANLRSIGYHYGSLQRLLLTAISTNWRRWLAPLIATSSNADHSPEERLQLGMSQFVHALPHNAPVLRAWLEAIVLARDDEQLRATLAANQTEFRNALARTLIDAGHPISAAELRAQAIIDVCDGIVVRFLLHDQVATPADVAARAATALAVRDASSLAAPARIEPDRSP